MNRKKKNKSPLVDKLLQNSHGKIDLEIEQAWIDEVLKSEKRPLQRLQLYFNLLWMY